MIEQERRGIHYSAAHYYGNAALWYRQNNTGNSTGPGVHFEHTHHTASSAESQIIAIKESSFQETFVSM